VPFNEKSLVEDHFVTELQKKGWKFTPSSSLNREENDEPLLIPTLMKAVKRINEGIGVGGEEIKKIIDELRLKPTGPNSSKDILNYLKAGVPVKLEKERLVKYVKLIDYENLENNDFTVSRQITNLGGDREIINDILLYVNGIPLVNIECKSPVNQSEKWLNAYTQIKEYEQAVPELYKYVQIGVAAREVARYFVIVPWLDNVETQTWKEPGLDSTDSTIEMLSPGKFLNILRYYLFTRIEYGRITKVIARYMQYRSSEKIYGRVMDYVQGKDSKNKGLIWHWQGSGKTLTMLFAANKLYSSVELQNPTIFFIVDREELKEQLFGEFSALDIPQPEIIGSIDALRSVIKHDEGKGKRGMLITLIHKFRPEELDALRQELENLDKETISTRKNIIAIIDEGHRTQYGLLAAQMKQILKNASFFAFTGTPISKLGRDTYQDFSYPPEENYLDRYFVADSIDDHYTVKIAYQPRLEDKVHLKRELLEAFWEVEREEIPEEYRDVVERKLKDKIDTIKIFLENPERIKLVANDIVAHFKENVNGKFKGMVIAVDRKACILYKRAIDQLLPKEYTEVVMTFQRESDPIIQDYERQLSRRFPGKDMDDIRKTIVRKFKEESEPRILIVTEMLLTGFDAPVLQTLYLDKPLKEHRLLQAVARTNRPYKDVKTAGLVLDYVGVFDQVVKAFEMYSKEDIQGTIIPIDDIREQFAKDIDNLMEMFKTIPKDQFDRETMLRAIEIITSNEQNSNTFLENYKRLRNNFELLGPDETRLGKLKEFKWLSAVYTYYNATVLKKSPEEEDRYVSEFYDRTVKYIYKSIELADIRRDLPVIEFDENYLKNLNEESKNNEEKAANIVFTLNRLVLVEKLRDPIYESLIDKVNRIMETWREKTKDYQKIYEYGAEIINEVNKINSRQEKLGFSDVQYSLLAALEDRFGSDKINPDEIRDLTSKISQWTYKGWFVQKVALKDVERVIRNFLRKNLRKFGISQADLTSLTKLLMDRVVEYAKKL
jgi:type I restriction enzyme R subunit